MMKYHFDETQRLEVKQYFEGIKKYAQSIPEKRYPHQNRYIALLHLLSDSVSSLTRKRMEDESEPAACEKGCDACCYFAAIIVSRSELDEIRHYVNAKQDEEVGVILKGQWSDWETQKSSAIQPCPFLIQEQGRCSVYPVRPMACRLLFSSRKCSREDESSGEFQSCQKFTRLGWQEMPLRPDTLLKALESQRSGWLDFEPGKLLDEEKIDLKAFTPKELWTMLNTFTSNKTQDDSFPLKKGQLPNHPMKKPYIIGLTGGIGCGKSTVARMLEKRGYPVIDADLLGHRVLKRSHPGFNEVIQAFGKGILDHEGRISRPKLGLMVFQDPKKLEKLNRISHPHIAGMIEEESLKLAQEQASRIVFLEAALLIETNWQETCQKVWVIDSKEENVLKRLALRNGLSREEAKQRISSQISSEERLNYADLVLENNGAESELDEKLKEALVDLQTLKD